MKPLDINRSIFEITSEYPELKEILRELGFSDITNSFTLKTAGKVMTLPKGCKMKDIDIGMVIGRLEESGFQVTGK